MKVDCILLVDDDEISNILNFGLLAKLSIAHEIKVASNGQNALSLIKDSINNSTKMPQLIILDLYMPVMNGWEFLHEFNQLNLLGEDKIQIIVLSGILSSDNVEELKSLGVKEVIKKPLTKDIQEAIFKLGYSV